VNIVFHIIMILGVFGCGLLIGRIIWDVDEPEDYDEPNRIGFQVDTGEDEGGGRG
jgi:hypothetical protein